MAKEKKIPQRMCIACRQMLEKDALVRITRSKEGEISLDFDGKKPGRGAYICKSEACLRLAKKAHALDRAFGQKIDDELYDTLISELSEV